MKHLYLLTFLLISFLATAQPQKVTDLNQVPDLSIDYNNYFYFNQGTELWVSDGTSAGTELVKDLQYEIERVKQAGNMLFIITVNGELQNVWISDGSETGTVLLNTFEGLPFSLPFVQNNSNYYFAADDGVNGMELWVTDGTPAGTNLVKDINPGADGSLFSEIVTLDGNLFFAAEDGDNQEIWKSDGTAAGTVILKDFSSLGEGYEVQDLVSVVDGSLIFGVGQFSPTPPYDIVNLYRSDGTEAGTVLIESLSPYVGLTRFGFYNFQNKLFFTAETGGAYDHLWVTDGTSAGTTLLTEDIYEDGGITGFAELSDKLVFTENAQNSVGIWETDGTPEGTVEFQSLEAYGADDRKMAAVDNTLFFADHETVGAVGSATGESDWELWQSEITEESTVMVKDLPGTEDTYYGTGNLVEVNNTLFFTTGDGPASTPQPVELWTYSQPFLEPVITATKASSLNNNKQVFPNPFDRSLNLNIQSDAEVTVFDLYGKQVYNQKHKKGSSVVDLGNVGAGVYYLKIGQDESKMVKVIKR